MEEESILEPLLNAAFLAGGDSGISNHNAIMMQPQQQQHGGPEMAPLPAPRQQVLHTMYAAPVAAAPVMVGQPLERHPTLPRLRAADTSLWPPSKKHAAAPSASDNPCHLLAPLGAVADSHPQNEAYRLSTNQSLLETSSRLDDAASELAKYAISLRGRNVHNDSYCAREGIVSNIETSIIPLLRLSSEIVKEAGKYFAPFSGTVNIHRRNDAEKKRRLVSNEEKKHKLLRESGHGNRSRPSAALLMIDEFVNKARVVVSTTTTTTDNNNATIMTAIDHHQHQDVEGVSLLPMSSSAKKRMAAALTLTSSIPKNSTTTTESIIILQPRNGSIYTKSEALAICKHYRKGSRERGVAIRAIISHGFVPTSRKTLYRLLRQDENGNVILDNGWAGIGRPMKDNGFFREGSGDSGGAQYVDSNLTFEDLDNGDNRILVVVNHKVEDGEEEDDDNGEEDNRDDNDDEDVPKKKKSKKRPKDNSSNNAAEDDEDRKKKKKRTMESNYFLPSSIKRGICTTPGCTNKIARRSLCVAHGMQNVDPKIVAFQLPPPQDGGSVYKKSECVAIAKQYKKGSSQRRLALEAMIYRGYVKNSLKSVYRLLLNDEKGIPIPDDNCWTAPGCPSVLTATEIDEVVERIKREGLRFATDDDVRKLIVDALKAKGVTSESKFTKMSSTTMRNYAAIFKSKLSTVYWKNGAESQQQMTGI